MNALTREIVAVACLMGAAMVAQAQVSPSAAASSTQAQQAQAVAQSQAAQRVDPSAAARFIEGCNQALERGVSAPGCQAPLYRNELEQLKREALNTQNPQLLSFVGDAYRSQRTGIGDLSQAYRWYLMAAVRGDPRALQQLSDMNRKGMGVQQDNVKALGYARLAERLTPRDGKQSPNVVRLINELGNEMAAEEMALAESFAKQLEERIRREAPGLPHYPEASSSPSPDSPLFPRSAVQGAIPSPAGLPASAAPMPGSVLPGVPAPLQP